MKFSTIFAKTRGYLRPDDVWMRLTPPRPRRRALYSYLLRLQRQGLLERAYGTNSKLLVYRLTERGYARIAYFRGS